MRHLLLVLLVALAAVPAQELADILPFSMKLDAAGKLVWDVPAPAACGACAGQKLVPCPRCERKPVPCGLCTDRKSPCRSCSATGKQLDPFVDMPCPSCSGTQRDPCPTCSGSATIVSPDGKEKPCGGCKGRRWFPCIECAGAGRLPIGADQPLRALSLEAARARREQLRALKARVERRSKDVARASEPPTEMALLLEEVREALYLPDGADDRLLALAAAVVGDDAQSSVDFMISQHTLSLERRIEQEQEVLEKCIWRHRRNAGEFDRTAAGVPANSIEWQFPFGADKQRPDVLWLLLGRGFLRAPTSDDVKDVVAAWFAEHPKALMTPLVRIDAAGPGPTKATWIQVRVADDAHDLGLHLVERGCIPAYVLIAVREEIEVPFADYLTFLRRAKELEAAAKQNKLGLWREVDPARDDDLAAARKRQLDDDHAGALELYEKAIAAGHDRADTWTQVGTCRLELGDDAGALAAFDRAIAGGETWEARRGKACALWRRDGEVAAVAFLKTLELEPHEAERWHGELCRQHSQLDNAIVHYEQSVALASAKHAFRFDAEGWLLVDEATMQKENNDFADLWPTLEDIASLHFLRGNDAPAMRFATMGIAIGQQLNRCRGYYDATEVKAGDVDCRVLRGRLFCKQGKLVEAETEERFARTLAKRSGYTGYQRQLQVLQAEIDALRRR
jgi:tetratricopeptide (TPR) repeat protein